MPRGKSSDWAAETLDIAENQQRAACWRYDFINPVLFLLPSTLGLARPSILALGLWAGGIVGWILRVPVKSFHMKDCIYSVRKGICSTA